MEQFEAQVSSESAEFFLKPGVNRHLLYDKVWVQEEPSPAHPSALSSGFTTPPGKSSVS